MDRARVLITNDAFHTCVIIFEVFTSFYADIFKLDKMNRKLFQCFDENLPRTALLHYYENFDNID